ncbi:sialidase family protein [Nocardioides sp. 503]|uniref:WD40/YVTN/BNR-like repeat-containing protein n=1 Tax=Nocardioides sp. 503 TaxID=2508326 RepID=UPI00106F1C52|nr:sialidase family protein [Nocardioides sp. 503]
MTQTRTVRGAVAVLLVTATAGLAVALLAPGSDESPPTPGGRPTTTPATAGTPSPAPQPDPPPDPASIVDDPQARMAGHTVRAADPDVRSVVWRLCRTPRCRRRDEVLAVTDDGFRTRHLLAVSPEVLETPLDGVFLLGRGARARLVQPDGSLTPVAWEASRPGPLRRGEHLVTVHRSGALYALHPATGRGHRVSAPRGILDVVRDGDGLLRGRLHDRPPRLVASADGGRTWTTTRVPDEAEGLLTDLVASASAARALVSGGDGATFLPFHVTHRSDDAGRTWTSRQQPGPSIMVNRGLAVLPDGRLLADLMGGGSPRLGLVGRQPSGLWLSDGQDWSEVAPVAMGAPFDALDLRREFSPVVSIEVARDTVTVYAATDTLHQTLWASTDAGTTWRKVRAR